jgi:single-strand DNA-binding protein
LFIIYNRIKNDYKRIITESNFKTAPTLHRRLLKVSNGGNKQIIYLKFTGMNTLKNSVSLIGNLGQAPEVTNFDSGKKVARFSVATHSPFKNKEGEWEKKTHWHNIVAWDKTAELCEKLLEKGAEVILEGELQNDSFTDKEGNKRNVTRVNMREFMLVNKTNKEA